ncbi:N-acetylmuramoyl-L-alanine amidase [Bacterioplanes sanyensis]|uniref:N-acetylmuramoyl-L-alanine amidase n=1 Tax=Bacterioplanes sanyensis TaxID=1249553 RepID=UPI0018EEC488|nr:N-acetylmuramoyl-L-alanine amidase [Bacterioplanes sanyensis]
MGNYQPLSELDTIIIHCSDTPNGRQHNAIDIDDWHHQRGFKRNLIIEPHHQPHLTAIGYHFVICLDGSIEAGRPLNESGAHARGYNRGSVGICLIGRDQYTKAQWTALEKLVLLLEKQLQKELNVIGHNQVSNKRCPGFDVQQWMYQTWDEEH